MKKKNITKLLAFALYGGCVFAELDTNELAKALISEAPGIENHVLSIPKRQSDQELKKIAAYGKGFSNELYESMPSTEQVKACASATAEWSVEAASAIGEKIYSTIQSMDADTIAGLALSAAVMAEIVSLTDIALIGVGLGLATPLVNSVVSRETVDYAFNTLSSGVGTLTGAVTGCAYGTTKSFVSSLHEVYTAPLGYKPVALVGGLLMTGYNGGYGAAKGACAGYRAGSNFAGYCSNRVGKVLDTFSFKKN